MTDDGIEVTDLDAPDLPESVHTSSSGPTSGKFAGLIIIAAVVAAWLIFGGVP